MRNKDMTLFLSLLLISYVGIAVGMITSKRTGISSPTVVAAIENIKSADLSFMSVFSNGMLSNIYLYILLIICGMMSFGLPVCLILFLYKGYAIGFSCGGLCHGFGIQGMVFAIFGVLLPSAVMICWLSYIINRIYSRKIISKIHKTESAYKAFGEIAISISGYTLTVCIQSIIQYTIFYIF